MTSPTSSGRQRQVRGGIVFIGVAQEKAQAFNGKKVNGRFEFERDKPVYVNHYYEPLAKLKQQEG